MSLANGLSGNISRVLTVLRSNNVLNSMTKDVVGFNIPNVLWAQSKNERVDQMVSQFGHTALVYGGTFGLQRGINQLFAHLHPQAFNRTTRQFIDPLAQQWFAMGKAAALYSFAAFSVNASSFLRNWVSLKRTRKLDFADMVGVNGDTRPDRPDMVQAELTRYRKAFTQRLGSAVFAVVGLLALSHAMIQRKLPVPKLMQVLDRHLGLPNGDFSQLKDLPTFLFMALPTYHGMLQGSRDQLEKEEVLYKIAGFGLAFLVLPRTLQKLTQRALQKPAALGKTFPLIGSSANVAFLVQLLSGIVFSASLPIAINLLKRQDRAEEMGLKRPAPVASPPYTGQYFGQSGVRASRVTNPFVQFQPSSAFQAV